MNTSAILLQYYCKAVNTIAISVGHAVADVAEVCERCAYADMRITVVDVFFVSASSAYAGISA